MNRQAAPKLIGISALGEPFRPLGATGLVLIVTGAHFSHRFGAVPGRDLGEPTRETPGSTSP